MVPLLTPLFFGWTISLTTDRFATFFQTYGLLSWGWRALRQKKLVGVNHYLLKPMVLQQCFKQKTHH
jgi:hypothetical protein